MVGREAEVEEEGAGREKKSSDEDICLGAPSSPEKESKEKKKS